MNDAHDALVVVAKHVPELLESSANGRGTLGITGLISRLSKEFRAQLPVAATRTGTMNILTSKVQAIKDTEIVRINKKTSFLYDADVAKVLQDIEKASVSQFKVLLKHLDMNSTNKPRNKSTDNLWMTAYASGQNNTVFDPFYYDPSYGGNPSYIDSYGKHMYTNCANGKKLVSYRYMHSVFEYMTQTVPDSKVLGTLKPVFKLGNKHGIFEEIKQVIHDASHYQGYYSTDEDAHRRAVHNSAYREQMASVNRLARLLGFNEPQLDFDEYMRSQGINEVHASEIGFNENWFHEPDPLNSMYAQTLHLTMCQTLYPLVCVIHMIRRRTCDHLCNGDKAHVELRLSHSEVTDVAMRAARCICPFSKLSKLDSFKDVYWSSIGLASFFEQVTRKQSQLGQTMTIALMKKRIPCMAIQVLMDLANTNVADMYDKAMMTNTKVK